jgi:DNA-binding NarL/FixJ family response regulator
MARPAACQGGKQGCVAYRLLIVDDNAMIRHLLRSYIEQDESWEICGEAENGKDAIGKVAELKPDLVILDLQMPVMNGLEAAREISAMAPNIVMVMFTMHCSPQLLEEARAAGVQDVISKADHLSERLLPALRQARG